MPSGESSGGESSGSDTRRVVYCFVPRDLAPRLHEPLRRHFADDPALEVVVERRGRERRTPQDRRSGTGRPIDPPSAERRLIRSETGRRVADRRACLIEVEPLALPRRARAHADRLVFLERLEPSGQQLEDVDTARLVTRIQGGDRDAFEILYLRYFDRVYSYLRVALRDRHEAEDVTQQAFVAVLESLPRYERRSQPFRAWMFVIVRRYALSTMQKQSRLDVTDPVQLSQRYESREAPADYAVLDGLSDPDLIMLIERLPLAQRQVLLLRYMLNLTYAEAAEVLDRSIDDIRALHSRARRFLEARLTALGRSPRVGRPERCRTFLRKAPVLRARRFVLQK
jgi:RNA polymerase sigma-70 factor (ECF subfamily)